MNRRAFFFRAWVLVFAMIGLAAIFAPNVQAQPYPCTCDVINVIGDKNLKCDLKFCVESPIGNKPVCYGVGPGSNYQIKCDKEFIIYVTDCKGNTYKVTEKCTPCICINDNCFVQLCLKQDDKGCWTLVVIPC